MNTRIRYVSARGDTNSQLVSLNGYTGATGETYSIYIDTLNMTYQITHFGTENIVLHGNGKTVAQLKSKSKKAIMSLGVVFENEKRTKVGTAEETAA